MVLPLDRRGGPIEGNIDSNLFIFPEEVLIDCKQRDFKGSNRVQRDRIGTVGTYIDY